MIILFAITGAISVIFASIIVVGVVRAHLHPDRYMPEDTTGDSKRSRAQGITRAILDAIPISTFSGDSKLMTCLSWTVL
jgi:hypothetical protein